VGARPAGREQVHGEKPEGDPAQMREVRDPAARLRMDERVAADHELVEEVDPQEEHGRDLEEEEGDDEGRDAAVRVEEEVRAEHCGDRPARPEVGDLGFLRAAPAERDDGLRRRRGEAAEDVEEDEADASERVFDVVPEDPEEEHVAEQVAPAGVQEQRGEDRRRPVLSDLGAAVLDLARVVGEIVDRRREAGISACVLVEDEGEHVRGDEPDRDDREMPSGDVVPEGDHRRPGLPDHERHERLLRVQAVLRLVPGGRAGPVEDVLGDLLAVVCG
jgi:hypothetical protein